MWKKGNESTISFNLITGQANYTERLAGVPHIQFSEGDGTGSRLWSLLLERLLVDYGKKSNL